MNVLKHFGPWISQKKIWVLHEIGVVHPCNLNDHKRDSISTEGTHLTSDNL